MHFVSLVRHTHKKEANDKMDEEGGGWTSRRAQDTSIIIWLKSIQEWEKKNGFLFKDYRSSQTTCFLTKHKALRNVDARDTCRRSSERMSEKIIFAKRWMQFPYWPRFVTILLSLSIRFGFKIDEPSGVRRKTRRKDQEDLHTMLILKRVQESLYLPMRLSRGIETNGKRSYASSWRDRQGDCNSPRLNPVSTRLPS